MRDHNKLLAFRLADDLAITVYRKTKYFPMEEKFGLTAQMRRAAFSIASNIAEGSGRSLLGDYLRFLDVAFASGKELSYQIHLSNRLGYLEAKDFRVLDGRCVETCKVLNGLIKSLRRKQSSLRPSA